ncbi:Outer membrane lipoprotein Slp, partial [mine drainage metagenome]
RFVACHPGFYDPEVYAKGRELTVTGTLQGTVVRRVGQYDYPYPRVVADAIHLWPIRVAYRGYYGYNSSFYSPFWGLGYSPWWGDGFYGGGFYGGGFYGDYDGGDDDD